MDYLRVSKLVYLADRESILKRGVPIVGGTYFSMRKGPTIGEFMDFVGTRNAPGWRETISPRFGNEIRLQKTPTLDALSSFEIGILDQIVECHRFLTTDELVKWCHDNCPEYQTVHPNRRKPISVESILRNAGRHQKSINRTIAAAQNIAELDELLA